ncbi:MAG: uracil-DNA glycosylase, partial [Rhodobacteraceae bacterium]|nr:uracil-DNA glycosylase [Paracoccaceae bacterium]
IEAALAADTAPVFPPRDKIFAALEAAGPGAVRVVILGQDPYHTAGKADGLAFSIPAGFPGRLGSLGNIFKELEADLGVTR